MDTETSACNETSETTTARGDNAAARQSADLIRGSHVLGFVSGSYWAMYAPYYGTMCRIISSWAGVPGAPLRLSREQRTQAIVEAQSSRGVSLYSAPPNIAILSLFGVISPRSGAIDDISQECCVLDSWASSYRSVMMDNSIAGVIIRIDSPGGNVYQVQETADLICPC